MSFAAPATRLSDMELLPVLTSRRSAASAQKISGSGSREKPEELEEGELHCSRAAIRCTSENQRCNRFGFASSSQQQVVGHRRILHE